MGELSKHMNQTPLTVQRIYDWHKQRGDAEPARAYLGASIIGHECERYLWYQFRGCFRPEFEGRLYRLFETGDLEEARFVKELRAIGCTVHDVDPETREQFEVMALGGHFSGHMDGCALGIPEAPKTWHVLEFKTHAAKYFAQVLKHGVEAKFPKHFAQMQCYMGLTKMKRALYLARNKDTDHLHSERIRYDAKAFGRYMDKAERIIRSNAPLDRCVDRQDSFKCKFCDAKAICWGDLAEAAVPIQNRNCETCCHATPELDGAYEDTDAAGWTCSRRNCELSQGERAQGCDAHLLLPGLVWFAEPVDSGEDWIEFENYADNARWKHGSGKGMWSTEELMQSPGVAVGDKAVEVVKDAFGGTVRQTPLTDRYNPGDSERLWDGPANLIGDALTELCLEHLRAAEPTRHEDDGENMAYEYASPNGDSDICVVIYKEHDYAAIWKGKS